MKKFLALVLALCMVLCLVACGQTDNGSDSGAKKITIFQQKAEIAEQLQEMAKAYTEETGVEVEVWAQAGDDYYTNLKTSLSSESGPTIFTLNSDAEIDEVQGYLADLGGLSFVDKIDESILAVRDGVTVGIPMSVEGFGLVYNADLVDTAALTGTDALVSMIETNAANNINTLGLSAESYFLAGHMFNFPFALQSDPNAFCEQLYAGEVKLVDVPEFVQYAQILEAIRANQSNPIEATYDSNCGDFATGKTAMIHQGNWAYGMFSDYDISFEMGMTGLPINGNTKICVGRASVWCVNSDASEEDQALAMDFLNWLYTSETGVNYLMNEFGFIPVVEGMTNDNLDPLSASVAEALANGDTIPWTFNTQWPAGIIDVDLAPITEQFFTTDMSATDYLNAINDAFVNAAK